MADRETFNDDATRAAINDVKAKYNEDRENNDREKDHEYNRVLHNMADKNTEAVSRMRENDLLKDKAAENSLDATKKASKDLLHDQRVEFGKAFNTVNEKNYENVSSLKDSYAKDRTKFVLKTQKEQNDEKVEMQAKLNQKVMTQEEVNKHKVAEIQKIADKNVMTTEAKLEQVMRQNEKDLETIKLANEDKINKLERAVQYETDVAKQEHQAELNNLRARYEKVIDHDRLNNNMQTNK